MDKSPTPTNTRTRYSSVQGVAGGGIQQEWTGGIIGCLWKTVLAVVRSKTPTRSTNGPLGSSLPGGTQGVWCARHPAIYLHRELGLLVYDICELLGVRQEQVEAWIKVSQ